MKTVEIKLYQFDELSKEAQETAITNRRKSNYENGDQLFFFQDYCHEEIKEAGFTNPKVQYSLSYSQGDGLSFSADGYNGLKNLFVQQLGAHHGHLAQYLVDSCHLEIKGNTGHYCYVHASDIDLYLEVSGNNETPLVDDVIEAVQNEITSIYMDLCRKLENTGYVEIDAQDSDEYIIEELQQNDYDFTVDGELY